ncbi:MAG: FxsA family protein [Solirubrobacterales bacterium]
MPLLLFLLFIIVPIAELYVIVQIGQAIGILPTIVLLLVDGFLGAALARSQGRAAWRRFNEATAAGRVPTKEVYDGVAIVFGGALLLTPGFISDILGISLLLPPTRALLRRALLRTAKTVGPARGAFFVFDRIGGGRPGPGPGPVPPRPPRPGPRSYDVEGSAREIPDDAPELDPPRDRDPDA